jgi:hypothetical protein
MECLCGIWVVVSSNPSCFVSSLKLLLFYDLYGLEDRLLYKDFKLNSFRCSYQSSTKFEIILHSGTIVFNCINCMLLCRRSSNMIWKWVDAEVSLHSQGQCSSLSPEWENVKLQYTCFMPFFSFWFGTHLLPIVLIHCVKLIYKPLVLKVIIGYRVRLFDCVFIMRRLHPFCCKLHMPPAGWMRWHSVAQSWNR